jgi:hypothetical protein
MLNYFLLVMPDGHDGQKTLNFFSDAIVQELTNNHLMDELSMMASVSNHNGRPFGR